MLQADEHESYMPTFRTSDDISIAYTRWERACVEVPVVLHHGFAANTQINWVAPGIVEALLQSGRSVLALDARGHGASEKPHDEARYGEPRMARDLVELLDHLHVRQFDLIGYSMGAVVSLIVASRDVRVQRMVIGGVGEGVLLSGGVDMRVMNRKAIVAALLAQDPATIMTAAAPCSGSLPSTPAPICARSPPRPRACTQVRSICSASPRRPW